MPDMDQVRRFAGADGGGEDPALEMCLKAAVSWYEGAGVPPETEGDDYEFWVSNLAAWMYDNRGNADVNAVIPPYIITSVHQLRYKALAQKAAREAKEAEEAASSSAESSGTGTGSGTETEADSSGTGTGSGTETEAGATGTESGTGDGGEG